EVVLAEAVEPQAQLVGQLHPLQRVGQRRRDGQLFAGDRVGRAVTEAVDAEFHASQANQRRMTRQPNRTTRLDSRQVPGSGMRSTLTGSNSRASSAVSATSVCTRASAAPRQKCGPCPKP